MVGVVIVDVTDRHRAQEELRESEAVLSGAQRMAGVGWWTWTVGPDAVVYAPELLDLLGRDPALGGRRSSVLKLQLADDGRARRHSRGPRWSRSPPGARSRAGCGCSTATAACACSTRAATSSTTTRARRSGCRASRRTSPSSPARSSASARSPSSASARSRAPSSTRCSSTRSTRSAARSASTASACWRCSRGGEQALIRALAARRDARRPATIAIEPGGVVDRALTRRAPVVVADLLADPEIEISALERQGGARSVAVVVIDGQTRPFGVLGAMSERPDHFNEDDAAFLSAIANVLADAVERRAAGGRDRRDLRRARPARRAGDRRRGPRPAQHLRGAARRRAPGAAGRPQRAVRAWPAAAATTPRSRPRRSA